jgi:hypothetical protein
MEIKEINKLELIKKITNNKIKYNIDKKEIKLKETNFKLFILLLLWLKCKEYVQNKESMNDFIFYKAASLQKTH